jgi:GDP-4-dehydro-6-deoxy-D-mannose reductase
VRTGQNASVVVAGSAAEYGLVEPQALPVTEEHRCEPFTDYGISKYAQTLLSLAKSRTGVPVLVARIFNPIGQGMPSHLALANFAAQIKPGQTRSTLEVGNLEVRRDFIGAAEAARLVVGLASQKSLYGGVYNICSGEAVQLKDIVEEMGRIAGGGVDLRVDKSRFRPSDMPIFYGSTTKLKNAGFHPEVPDFSAIIKELLS